MIIYPDIEIHKGQCVTLKHGSIAQPQVFEIKPLEAAKKFEQGAQWLHMVDLDGVFEYHGENSEIIKQIIAEANVSVQVGGGIRSATLLGFRLLKVNKAFTLSGLHDHQFTIRKFTIRKYRIP